MPILFCFNKNILSHISTFCEFGMQLRKNGTFSFLLLEEEFSLPMLLILCVILPCIVFNIAAP
jgi:hypothetical protein